MEVTNSELKEAILSVKEDVLNLREDFVDFKNNDFTDLRVHVNHEIEVLTSKIDGKLDNAELLTSLGFNAMNNKFVRWGIGALVFATIGTVASSHWVSPFWSEVLSKIAGL